MGKIMMCPPPYSGSWSSGSTKELLHRLFVDIAELPTMSCLEADDQWKL